MAIGESLSGSELAQMEAEENARLAEQQSAERMSGIQEAAEKEAIVNETPAETAVREATERKRRIGEEERKVAERQKDMDRMALKAEMATKQQKIKAETEATVARLRALMADMPTDDSDRMAA
ncbi:MAG: hypothetical protein CO137_00565 [Candidatus Magasanikbacteria bacterium CG_4_9_14_3_um_filter_32_9]|uniref:Uncharacterized protein n=1 Tax=Candidatus Magasanikbacteria bacterium CG_4_9_14_3_um_filter_32_9 TaxID=1974644 RepID=A0A2M7Z7U2_9BACT|nr:MAG: hypothetical protein CO137_00565 [Candidatus Magasanikbacteria bacterium CG_4_9_14_3_um_filter_32_9]